MNSDNKVDAVFYENLSLNYKKMLHSVVRSYKKLEKENLLISIIMMCSLLLNTVFLAIFLSK